MATNDGIIALAADPDALLDIRTLSSTASRRQSPPPARGAPDPALLHTLLSQLNAGDAFEVGKPPNSVAGVSGLTQRANRAVTAQAAIHAKRNKRAWKRGLFKTTLMLEFSKRDESESVAVARGRGCAVYLPLARLSRRQAGLAAHRARPCSAAPFAAQSA